MGIEFTGLLLFAISQVSTPGPANMALMTTGAAFGFKSALPFVFGVVCGKQFIIWPIGLGILVLLDDYPILFDILKWLSCIYICWLAYRVSVLKFARPSATGAAPSFQVGLILHPLNPKAWAMIMASMSGFVEPNTPNLQATTIIAVTYFLCQLCLHPLWCWGGDRLFQTISNKPQEKYFMYFLSALTVFSVFFIF